MTKFAKGKRSEKNEEELSGLDFVPEGFPPAMLYSPTQPAGQNGVSTINTMSNWKSGGKFLNLKSAKSSVLTVDIV